MSEKDIAIAWRTPRSVYRDPPPPIDVDALNNTLKQFQDEYPKVSSYLARWLGSLDLPHFGRTIKGREVVIAVIASSKNPICSVGYYQDLAVLPLTEKKKTGHFPLGFDLEGVLSFWVLVSFDDPLYASMSVAARTLRDKISDCYFVLPMCTYHRTAFSLFAVVPHTSVRPITEDFTLPRVWDHYLVEYVNEVFLKDTIVYPNSETLFIVQKYIGVPFPVPCLGCNIGAEDCQYRHVGGTLGCVVVHQGQRKVVTAAHVALIEGQTTNNCVLYQPNSVTYELYRANCELLTELPSGERPKLLCRDELIIPSREELDSGVLPPNVNCIDGIVNFSPLDRRALDLAIVSIDEQAPHVLNQPQMSVREWESVASESIVPLPREALHESVVSFIQHHTGSSNPFPVAITGFAEDNFLQEFWNRHGHVPFPVFKIGAASGLTFGAIYYSSTLAETPGLIEEVESFRTVEKFAVFSWSHTSTFAQPGDSGAPVCSFNGQIIGFIAEKSVTVTSAVSISSIRKIWPDLELLQ
ncbi:hypothetical protein RCL1_000787 [Eukaryota sp. TZLM3-RCL]